MKIYKTLLIGIFFPLLLQAKNISDELVENLSCENITTDSIYAHIKDDGFSVERSILQQNWSTGVIANCWSLSHAQRLHFYLGRKVAIGTDNITDNFENIFNMIRNSIPDLTNQPMSQPKEIEKEVKLVSVYLIDRLESMPSVNSKKFDRPFDVVLYGATGFVGRQTVAYFAQSPAVVASNLRWALAGRNAAKLEQSSPGSPTRLPRSMTWHGTGTAPGSTSRAAQTAGR